MSTIWWSSCYDEKFKVYSTFSTDAITKNLKFLLFSFLHFVTIFSISDSWLFASASSFWLYVCNTVYNWIFENIIRHQFERQPPDTRVCMLSIQQDIHSLFAHAKRLFNFICIKIKSKHKRSTVRRFQHSTIFNRLIRNIKSSAQIPTFFFIFPSAE